MVYLVSRLLSTLVMMKFLYLRSHFCSDFLYLEMYSSQSMCGTDEGPRSNRKMERSSGMTQVVFVSPMYGVYRWRSNSIRLENVSRIFIIVYSSRNPNKIWRKNIFKDRIIFMSMTLYGTRMMRNVFRMHKKSRLTRWDSQKDIGYSWVEARKKRGMEVLTTLRKENGIAQPTKWCDESKKLVVLYEKVGVRGFHARE